MVKATQYACEKCGAKYKDYEEAESCEKQPILGSPFREGTIKKCRFYITGEYLRYAQEDNRLPKTISDIKIPFPLESEEDFTLVDVNNSQGIPAYLGFPHRSPSLPPQIEEKTHDLFCEAKVLAVINTGSIMKKSKLEEVIMYRTIKVKAGRTNNKILWQADWILQSDLSIQPYRSVTIDDLTEKEFKLLLPLIVKEVDSKYPRFRFTSNYGAVGRRETKELLKKVFYST